MDKASIIGDTALYVQELQMHTMVLRDQMGISLEESEVDKPQQPSYQTRKKIVKMEVVHVGERGLVKLVCNKGKGVAVSLYEALDSLTSLDVESSILLDTVAESFELKFTLNVGKLDVNSANLKLWVARAFLNHGFDFTTSSQP